MGLLIQPKTAPRGAVHIIDPPANLAPNIRITPQARYYALAELTRRAGIPVDFFRKWKVTVSREKTIFEISNGARKFILSAQSIVPYRSCLLSLAGKNCGMCRATFMDAFRRIPVSRRPAGS